MPNKRRLDRALGFFEHLAKYPFKFAILSANLHF